MRLPCMYLNLLLQVQLAAFHPPGTLQAKPAIAALEYRNLEMTIACHGVLGPKYVSFS